MIGIVDCNSFYCSCERLFRPELINTPVVVLSNNDGCAVSRTDEAKQLGVKMGQPFFEFKSLCKEKGLVVFSSNFHLYTNLSDRVMETLKDLSPKVEVYSIDEAFLDLSGMNSLDKFGHNIKKTIERDTGIPVSVGISKTKTLAKVANKIAKKNKMTSNGVVILENQKEINLALRDFPVSDLWGIGSASAHKLNLLGIKTAFEFANYRNEKQILKLLTKTGLMVKHELLGTECHKFGSSLEKKKEIMCSRSFDTPKFNIHEIKESIANFVDLASSKMRRQQSYCSRMDIFYYTSPFNEVIRHSVFQTYRFAIPTLDTLYITDVAMNLIDKTFRHGFGYKKAGVRLYEFTNIGDVQLGLFEDYDQVENRRRLMTSIDKVNSREGVGTLKSASCGTNNYGFNMRQVFKSPSYLTVWECLKGVN